MRDCVQCGGLGEYRTTLRCSCEGENTECIFCDGTGWVDYAVECPACAEAEQKKESAERDALVQRAAEVDRENLRIMERYTNYRGGIRNAIGDERLKREDGEPLREDFVEVIHMRTRANSAEYAREQAICERDEAIAHRDWARWALVGILAKQFNSDPHWMVEQAWGLPEADKLFPPSESGEKGARKQ